MGWFDSILGGIGNFAKSGASGIGNALSGLFKGGGSSQPSSIYDNPMVGSFNSSVTPTQTSQAFPLGVSNFGGSIGNFNAGQPTMSGYSYFNPQIGQTASPGGGGFLQKGMSALGNLFTGGGRGGDFARGLGLMGVGAMIPNAKAPNMPSEYNEYMNLMKQGGTPGMQAANQYYMGVLTGNNKDAYDAAYHSLDLNYEEQLRQLNAMYKSLRPGTDPTTDSTYQRDLALLNDQYSRARAQVGAQVQQGAAAGAAGLGTQQMGGMQAGIQSQLDNLATQWGLSSAKRQALMSQVMGLGGSMASEAISPQSALWKKLFPGMV